MTVLWILLILICIIFVILLMPLTIRFEANGDMYLDASFLFIKYRVWPKKSDKVTIIDKLLAEFNQIDDLLTKWQVAFEALKKVLTRLKQILKFLKVSKFDVDIKIGTPDAADTAMYYGGFNGLFHTALGYITPLFRWGERKISIMPDFISEKSSASADIIIKGALLPFVIIALLLYKDCKKLLSSYNKTV